MASYFNQPPARRIYRGSSQSSSGRPGHERRVLLGGISGQGRGSVANYASEQKNPWNDSAGNNTRRSGILPHSRGAYRGYRGFRTFHSSRGVSEVLKEMVKQPEQAGDDQQKVHSVETTKESAQVGNDKEKQEGTGLTQQTENTSKQHNTTQDQESEKLTKQVNEKVQEKLTEDVGEKVHDKAIKTEVAQDSTEGAVQEAHTTEKNAKEKPEDSEKRTLDTKPKPAKACETPKETLIKNETKQDKGKDKEIVIRHDVSHEDIHRYVPININHAKQHQRYTYRRPVDRNMEHATEREPKRGLLERPNEGQTAPVPPKFFAMPAQPSPNPSIDKKPVKSGLLNPPSRHISPAVTLPQVPSTKAAQTVMQKPPQYFKRPENYEEKPVPYRDGRTGPYVEERRLSNSAPYSGAQYPERPAQYPSGNVTVPVNERYAPQRPVRHEEERARQFKQEPEANWQYPDNTSLPYPTNRPAPYPVEYPVPYPAASYAQYPSANPVPTKASQYPVKSSVIAQNWSTSWNQGQTSSNPPQLDEAISYAMKTTVDSITSALPRANMLGQAVKRDVTNMLLKNNHFTAQISRMCEEQVTKMMFNRGLPAPQNNMRGSSTQYDQQGTSTSSVLLSTGPSLPPPPPPHARGLLYDVMRPDAANNDVDIRGYNRNYGGDTTGYAYATDDTSQMNSYNGQHYLPEGGNSAVPVAGGGMNNQWYSAEPPQKHRTWSGPQHQVPVPQTVSFNCKGTIPLPPAAKYPTAARTTKPAVGRGAPISGFGGTQTKPPETWNTPQAQHEANYGNKRASLLGKRSVEDVKPTDVWNTWG